LHGVEHGLDLGFVALRNERQDQVDVSGLEGLACSRDNGTVE
jgi:hypothetical protein